MRHLFPILLVDSALATAAYLYANSGQTTVAVSIALATLLLMIWQWVVVDAARMTGQTLRVENGVRRVHYLQALCQSCVYVCLGLYWKEIGRFAPLIVVQIVFAYAIEMLLAWSRYRNWRVGFGPLPIILSINLFMWFPEKYFYFQLGLVVLAYFGKEFVCWNRDGRRVHIFNPSAFPLALVSLVLLATGTFGSTRTADLIASFDLPPNMFETIFLVGFVGQLLYQTTLVSLGSVLSQWLMYTLTTVAMSVAVARIPIEPPVFLGLTLLVTDPSTTPRSKLGRLLCGLAYGGGVYLIFIGLRLIVEPSFVDKLLMVPIVNLMVPWFDRIGEPFQRWMERGAPIPILKAARFAWVGVYTGVFLCILPALKNPPPRPPDRPFVPVSPLMSQSPSMTRLLDNRDYCQRMLPAPFAPFGFRAEIADYGKIREVYERGPVRSDSQIRSVVADGSTAFYVVGSTNRPVPGQMIPINSDAFVHRYEAIGEKEIWNRQFGGASDETAFAVGVDAAGAIYVAGETNGSLPGQSSAGGSDAFLRKYDSSGAEIWTRQFGSESHDTAFGIGVAAQGAIYVTGVASAALPGQTSEGGTDAFVSKFDADGMCLWTQQFGSTLDDVALSVCADESGAIYLAGTTSGVLTQQTSVGKTDAFVRCFDHNGMEIWTRQFGSSADDAAVGVAVDSSGVYVAGRTAGALPAQTNLGASDAFVCKFDHGGSETWTRQFGSTADDEAVGVALDPSGVYVAGRTRGALPGQASAGKTDTFVCKYARVGREGVDGKGLLWNIQRGTPADDEAMSLCLHPQGVIVVGRTGKTGPAGTSKAPIFDAFVVIVPYLSR